MIDRAKLIRLRQDLEDAVAHQESLDADFIARVASMTAEERVDADVAKVRAEQRREDAFHEYHKALADFTRRKSE